MNVVDMPRPIKRNWLNSIQVNKDTLLLHFE